MKIWTWGCSPQSGSRNAWTRIKNVNGASRLSNIWNFFGAIQMITCRALLVTMDKTWLYHYDPETKQQSMEWRHSGSPYPKNSERKIPLEMFSLRFFWIKTVSSSLIISQRAKLSTQSITYLCWCKWRTFLRKNAAGSSPMGPCSCTTMPRLTGHLQPRRNWPTWASSVLITHPILRIWSRRTTTSSMGWKTIGRSPFFVRSRGHCCRGDLVGRAKFWFFFELLAKVRTTG